MCCNKNLLVSIDKSRNDFTQQQCLWRMKKGFWLIQQDNRFFCRNYRTYYSQDAPNAIALDIY